MTQLACNKDRVNIDLAYQQRPLPHPEPTQLILTNSQLDSERMPLRTATEKAATTQQQQPSSLPNVAILLVMATWMARLTPVVHICYWRLASASADHATTLQVPSAQKAGLPMVLDACVNDNRTQPTISCMRHASCQVVFLVCCARLCMLPGKEGCTTIAPPGCPA